MLLESAEFFIPLEESNDTRLSLTLAYLRSRYPLLSAYEMEDNLFQIVTGINIWVRLRSPSGLHIVEAIVNIDLSMTPLLLEFHTALISTELTAPEVARQMFDVCTMLLVMNPELLEFRTTNALVETSPG